LSKSKSPLKNEPGMEAEQYSFGRQLLRIVLLLVVPFVVVVLIGIIYLHGGRYVETDNSYIKATRVPISAEVSGIIQEMLVHENQNVTAGELLFRLDPEPFKVALEKAEAKLAEVDTNLAALKASYREKQAEITLAQTKYTFANKEQHRQADLLAKKVVPTSSFDAAKQNTDLAAQEINTQQQDLKRIAAMLGGEETDSFKQHPSYLAALAELNQARLDLARVEIRAPRSGVVTRLPAMGQFITASNIAMMLVITDKYWVEANFTETDLTYVQPGQPATVQIDTYPGTNWHGVVESVSPATGAEFSVIPAQNATGNWVKITQRVSIRIKLDNAGTDQQLLRSGLSASVTVDTGHQRQLFGYTF